MLRRVRSLISREYKQVASLLSPCRMKAYPIVRKDDTVIEELFGHKIPDPYRWLEDPDYEETVAFVKAQNEVTNDYLGGCTYVDKMKKRVLYQLKTLDSEPVVFLDPNVIDPDGLAAIRGYDFSEEGEHLCYGISHGGSDWAELKFKSVQTGENLPDVLRHVKFSNIQWTHDAKGLFYCMYPDHEGRADGTETTSNQNQKLMYHRLGTDQSADQLCVARPDHPKWIIGCELSVCGRYLLVSFHDGCDPNNQLYYCDLAAINYDISSPLNLIPIADKFEAVYEYVTNEGSLFTLRTNLDATMYKLITIDLSKPERTSWKDLIPEDKAALLECSTCVHQDKLIVSRLKDVKSCLSVHNAQSGEKLTDLDLAVGSVGAITGRKRDSMAFVSFTSFLTPGQIFSCDFTKESYELKLFRESKLNNIDLSHLMVKQVFYESRDKTRIPMFIVGPREMVLDGSRPCKLYGYGGFDISITPSFSVSQLLFLLHLGGIFVVANIRGGGEYGKPWHDAGRRRLKQNGLDDFQSAAEYLIREGYTCRDKLFISGGSNGGLLVCACANQRPDLFGAVISHVPVCDLLRFHKFTIGHAWISDYGDPENADDFAAIIRYSPLHNIKRPKDPNVQYPAFLILTADHDDRVVPLHSFKFIATLQSTLTGDGTETLQKLPLMARIETKAGHGAGKPTSKMIEEIADVYAFLMLTLKLTWKD